MNHPSRFALLALVASLSACSVMQGDKIDYKSAGKAPTLEVPPDLTQLSRDNRYAVPGGAVTASGFRTSTASAPGQPAAVSSVGDVRIERDGNTRWLVIKRSADKLWDPTRDFWLENGFLLTTDQSSTGIMETDWAENRAKLPQDFIRQTLGKVLDSLYSTSERDRFRTRMERRADGATEIYISHRGMVEVYTSVQKDNTVWQPRPSDPELEAEFLRRLMVKLGVSQEQSKTLMATGTPVQTPRAATVGGQPVVQIAEPFDRAWRRVGLALDRTGFTVEDRDRNAGTYFVRYVTPTTDRKEPSILSKILSFGRSKPNESPLKFRIVVKSQGETSTVSVQNEAGAPDTSADAQRIVQVIADDLK